MAEYTDPFGLILKASGQNVSLLPYYTKLPEGVNSIHITWDGDESLRVYTATEQATEYRQTLVSIPAGTGMRSAVISGFGVDAGETIYIGAQLFSTTPAPQGKKATMTVINIPLKMVGGGRFLQLARSVAARWTK